MRCATLAEYPLFKKDMKQKQINTGKADILLVELPDGAYSIDVVSKTDNPNILKTDHLIFSVEDGDRFDHYDSQSLPEGNWSILSRADEVTEARLISIVPEVITPLMKFKAYPNFNTDGYLKTALESLYSLYEANKIYWSNPLGVERPTGRNTLDLVPFEYAKESLSNSKKRWDNYQQNVWDKSRTVILIKK